MGRDGVGQCGSDRDGAVIAGVVGILAFITQQWLARRHELESARVQRLSEFSAAGWAASLAIIKLAQSPQSRKAALENSAAHQNAVDRFNSILAQIQLLDLGEVYEAAHRVNECLVHLGREAAARRADGSTWRATRADLSNAVAAYQQAARKALGAKAIQGHEPWRKHDLGTRSLQAAFTPRRLRRWWLIP